MPNCRMPRVQHSLTVADQRYSDGMDNDGLTRLVVSLMVSGGVSAVDALRPADAHAAVLRAVEVPGGHMLPHVFGATVQTIPDPGVGLRVLGLTKALWEAVGRGWLEPCSGNGHAMLVLSEAAAVDPALGLSQLAPAQSDAVRHAGAAWAASSTSLKNTDSALASSRST